MKKILGLDIGTTSIGWAIVELADEKKPNTITGKEAETDINNERVGLYKHAVGVRIIAQDTERFDRGLTLNDPKGIALTATANRRLKRSSRRLKSRYKLRRGKLLTILSVLGIIPDGSFIYEIKSPNTRGKWMPDEKSTSKLYTKDKRYTFDERGNKQRIKRVKDIGEELYELRHKALTEKIELQELGRILLHLNQWRGYSSDRFAKEEKPKFDYYVAEIIEMDEANKVAITDENNKEDLKYYQISIKIRFAEPYNLGDEENKNIINELNGVLFKKEIDFKIGDLVTVKKPELRQEKKGKTILSEYYKISFTVPDPSDWNYKYQTLQKNLTQWCEAGSTVGSYFYKNFYETHSIPRIRNQVVNRNWYEHELDKILETQYSHHKEFFEHLNIEQIVKLAFKDHQPILNDILTKVGIKEQLKCLIKDKVIFFQRPWQQAKNKGECPFEKIKVRRERSIKGTGKKKVIEEYAGRKVIPKSHPLFQEFRIWQQINNVRIYLKIEDEKIDLFAEEKNFEKYVGKKISEVKNTLFDALQKNKTLSWKSFAENELGLKNKKEIVDKETGEVVKIYFEYNYRKLKRDKATWEDIKLKGNNTLASIQSKLPNKTDGWFKQIHSAKQQITNLELLWQLIYDITNNCKRTQNWSVLD